MKVIAALAAGLLLAACGGSNTGVMGRSSSSARGMQGGFGGGMMGSAPPGYHFSSLRCAEPSSFPGTRVEVVLGDMGMAHRMGGVAGLGQHMMLRAAPAQVPSGQVSFLVDNMGWRTHELVVLPLGSGQAAGQRTPGADGRVDETGSPGEASASCAAGEGEGIESGSVGWVTLDLPPGRYELVCNLRNHYANGMHQLLVVT